MRFLLILAASLLVFALILSGYKPGSIGDAGLWSWLSRLLVVLIIVVVALGFRKRPSNRSVSD